eukprot:CAMPEP_0182468138 /NCGR_PEP_ID=MMETSP1319-20130603/15016_1 /TAXON_ID=172717 /ORGANISM="Bolidomonas pacifica, Strain RCC208" /LENGTH=68 /DNA_ID=CAMNT_0024668305 /DNA_START=138 /DNA_END=347 /DNA_ORIENTATION=-
MKCKLGTFRLTESQLPPSNLAGNPPMNTTYLNFDFQGSTPSSAITHRMSAITEPCENATMPEHPLDSN